jgi:hypothetical protein
MLRRGSSSIAITIAWHGSKEKGVCGLFTIAGKGYRKRNRIPSHDTMPYIVQTTRLWGQGGPMKTASILAMLVVSCYVATAFAQTAPPPTKHPASSAQTTSHSATTKPQSAASIECSKQADAKNLHGKARKEFRSSCKKQMMKKS